MQLSTILLCAFSALVAAAPAPAQPAQLEKRAVLAELFPNYLIPIKKNLPDTAFGTQYTGNVSYVPTASGSEVVLLVGFDVPNNAATVCKLKFVLPQGTPWALTGTPKINYYRLATPTALTATWNNRPARINGSVPDGTITIPLSGGTGVVTGSFPCNKGARNDFYFEVARPGPGSFYWFELTTPKTGVTLEMSN